jgi:hypothetical protein
MSNDQLDAVVRSIRPTLEDEGTYETERAQLLLALLEQVNDHVQNDLTSPASAAEVTWLNNLMKAAKPAVTGRLPIRAVVAQVRPALQSAPTTEAERRKYVYDLLRAVYTHVRDDVHFSTEDTPERTRIGKVVDMAGRP